MKHETRNVRRTSHLSSHAISYAQARTGPSPLRPHRSTIQRNPQKDIVDNKTKVGDYTERYYAAMPAIKFSWARGEFITLFSKLALGPCLHNKTDKIYMQTQVEYSSSHLGLLGQITLLGIEIGSRLKVFGELGIGAQGVYNVGLRYKF